MLAKSIVTLSTVLLLLGYYEFIIPIDIDLPEEVTRSLWDTWKSQYQKGYESTLEDENRYQIFKQNVIKVNRWNSEGHSFTKAINKFADLTGPEFKKKYADGLGIGLGEDKFCPSAGDCPNFPTSSQAEVNWTMLGAVTPVKDQKDCGSCWAFSTTGALEALFFFNNSYLVSLSEQQLVDCAKDCYGCMGCWPYLALNYTLQYGLEPEIFYPYQANELECGYKKELAVQTNTGYECVAQNSTEQMMAAVALIPVSIGVEADEEAWQMYSGGVITTDCGAYLDHAVLITGYGPVEGHKGKAWYVKNSWGADWGADGYVFLGQNKLNGEFGVCGVLRCGVIPKN